MATPPFTVKTACTYLAGVAAVLTIIILLAMMLMHARPHQEIQTAPPTQKSVAPAGSDVPGK